MAVNYRGKKFYNIGPQVEPTSAGFVRFAEMEASAVHWMKGFVKNVNDATRDSTSGLPTKMSSTVVVSFNAKISSHTGVICPFSHQLIR
jgi:hypothetical protein